MQADSFGFSAGLIQLLHQQFVLCGLLLHCLCGDVGPLETILSTTLRDYLGIVSLSRLLALHLRYAVCGEDGYEGDPDCLRGKVVKMQLVTYRRKQQQSGASVLSNTLSIQCIQVLHLPRNWRSMCQFCEASGGVQRSLHWISSHTPGAGCRCCIMLQV